MTTKRPAEEDFSTAIAWLRVNEGNGGEAQACQAIADWLEGTLLDATLKREARAQGIPIAKLRAALAKRQSGQ